MSNKRTFTSAQYIYKNARHAVLSLILFAVMNIALCLVGLDIYFVSGVFLAYFLSVGGGTTGILAAISVLIPFVLCFFFSKRKRGWLVAALVMVCIDTLWLICVALGSERSILFLADILFHGSALAMLAMGVKNGKAATDEQECDPYHQVEDVGTDGPPDNEEGAFTDIACDLKISKSDRRFGLSLTGVARFYETEVALGGKNTLQEGIMGSRLTPIDEKLRFAYTDIDRAFYRDVNEFNVQIDLVDGRACRLFLTRGTRPKVVDILSGHGIAIEPYQ